MTASGWETLAFYLVPLVAARWLRHRDQHQPHGPCPLGTGGVALLYFLLAANFLGVISSCLRGGTLIVIVFGVMLTSRAYGIKLRPKRIEAVAGLLSCGVAGGVVESWRRRNGMPLIARPWPPQARTTSPLAAASPVPGAVRTGKRAATGG